MSIFFLSILLFSCQEDQQFNEDTIIDEQHEILHEIFTLLLSKEQVTGTYTEWVTSFPFYEESYQLRWDDDAIEWRLSGETTWHTIIPISDLMDYNPLKSYEIFKMFYPHYNKDEIAFIADIESNSIIEYLDIWVYFDLDGGSFSDEFDLIMKLQDLNHLPTPTKQGFIFQGWYVDNQTDEVVSDLSFEDDITLFARWSIERYQDYLNEGTITLYPQLDGTLSDHVILYLEVKNILNETIFYIYECEVENQYGKIQFSVVIDHNHYIIDLDIISKELPYRLDELASDLDLYEGSLIYKYQPKDALTTGSTIDFNSIRQILSEIGIIHEAIKNDIDEIYSDWFNVNYIIELDQTFVPTDMVISKGNVYDQNQYHLGYIYTLTGFSMYEQDMMLEGAITIQVGLLNDGTIVGIYLPLDTYQHSKGGFYELVVNFTEQFINQNIDLIAFPDTIAGATHSKTLFVNLLLALQNILY